MFGELKQKWLGFWTRLRLAGPEAVKIRLLDWSIGLSVVVMGLVVAGTVIGVYFGRHWVWGQLLKLSGVKQSSHQVSNNSTQPSGANSQGGPISGGESGGSGESGDDEGSCPPGEDCGCPPNFSGKNCRARDFTAIGWAIPCQYAFSIKDDPILLPGRPGEAALNDFRGNLSANAFSTYKSLSAHKSDWNCHFKPGWDHSATYTPHMYLNGGDYASDHLFTYHLLPKGVDPTAVEPLPDGIQLVTDADHVTWSCGSYDSKIHKSEPTKCTGLHNPRDPTQLSSPDAWITLPNCWDGDGLGYTHTIYPTTGHACPASHPHVFPRIKFQFNWIVPNQDATGATFATDGGQNNGPLFAEFYDAWKPGVFAYLTTNCLNHQIKCGSVANACGAIWKALGVWDEAICGKNKHIQ